MNNITQIGPVSHRSDAVSAQTNDAMAELGGMTVAGLLGTYQRAKDDSDQLLLEALSLRDAGELQTDHASDVWRNLERAQRRLWIYSLLATEAFS